MSVQEVEELVEEKETGEEVEKAEPEKPSQEQIDLEARAKRMGWVPKEDYHGPEENWRSAEEFIAVGENIQSVLKDRLRKSDDQVVALTKEIGDLKGTMKEFAEHHSKVEKRAYERALKELKDQQRKAVEEGDTAAYDRAAREIEDLSKDAETPKVPEHKPGPEEDPAFKSWSAENSWYDNDMVLAGFADNTAAPFIARTRPDLRGRAFFDAVTEAVKERFPDKFTNTRRAKPSAVEGAGEVAEPKKTGKKTYADLPPEARAACDRFVAQGLVTKDQYVKDYEWE